MVVRFLSAAEHCYLQAVVSQPRTRLWLLPLQDSSTDTEKAMEQVLRLPELDVVHSKPAHAQWEPLQDWHIRKRNYQHRRKGRQWTAKADGAFESTPRTLADTDLKGSEPMEDLKPQKSCTRLRLQPYQAMQGKPPLQGKLVEFPLACRWGQGQEP